MVSVRWTGTGTPAGLPGLLRRIVGRSGPITMANTYRMRDGRVVEVWNNRDDLTMMREMGVFRLYGLGGFLVGSLVTGVLAFLLGRRRSAVSAGVPIRSAPVR